MTGDVTPYTDKITSEHSSRPNFMATVATCCQPLADMIGVVTGMPTLYDLDYAVGSQLDATGQWIGQSRQLDEPLTGVYFSLDAPTLGLDQGSLMGPFDPTNGLVSLPDAAYRTLLYAKVAANHWDGTVPGAYNVLAQVFPGDTVFIQDNGDMSMLVGLVGPVSLDATTYALLTGGYLAVKPVGVSINGYATSSVLGAPIFGLGADNSTIGGLDHGALATITGGN